MNVSSDSTNFLQKKREYYILSGSIDKNSFQFWLRLFFECQGENNNGRDYKEHESSSIASSGRIYGVNIKETFPE